MIAYEFYWSDKKGEKHFIWILPERRKSSERVTRESIINWGRKAIVDDTEAKDIFFTQVEIDEAQIESQGQIPLSELRKRFRKKTTHQFSRE
jgi:acyl-CoA synthetase (AMP-forming)/AMP-acid ligase II